ncbi:hypothetical protein AGABI2DRAFT_180250 [Agaricus bisporus var. bisporus H97]|uniref:hypothetical protein n=1 Tax=Agaricus bisporus var. bisporus (strain H97 / ATCC MYA-4626 / FGSC 10389) TaxID=936046 RepID=UPI00029F6F56|nr:hypothetical protein AGABI2DRAFT_180250 [Agaricus bisporus var. bisporus H97]EKV43767.1 hypothetical protein AGABI2DRAFT_180250 [Agaricus bisporus var. bisporus H97]
MRTSAGNADYELDVSPRSSLSDVDLESSTPTQQPPQLPTPAPGPSIKLLFSLLSRGSVICLLLPAILTSIIAGGVAPFMTYVIGQSFDAFAHFSSLQTITQQDKDGLLHDVGIAALELLALGVGALALASITSSLWIWTGERNAAALRRALYQSMEEKDMFWYDTTFGEQDAGGIMAKFTRETDDVRMATSLASGYLVQYLTTTIACLVLAFIGSWALTLVILSAVPLLTLIQAMSQRIASPLLFHERHQTAVTATLISRVLSSITTVKAYNAQPYERSRAASSFETLRLAARRLNKVWGVTSGMGQFVMMGMFVQGFWFGGKLVRDGKISSGDVMAVFWACLIATSNLQMCIPQFIILAKGKFSMAALMEIIHGSSSSSDSSRSSTAPPPTSSSFKTSLPGKVVPSKVYGEISIRNISFSYPSKPSHPVLNNVSIYIPANEFTFIVGSSGSGKSTIASLLMGLYQPSEGQILLDDRDFSLLDKTWLRGVLGAVSQSGMVVLDGRSVWDNIAVGVYGRPGETTSVDDQEVNDACRMALVHEFVKDLPEGYDTILGSGSRDGEGEDDKGTGIMLSGGQRQRLEIARARIRDPEILILDEATSALDVLSRVLVFSALRQWRRDKTTLVITHELAQIEREDFVYVLKSGKVAEQGYRRDLEKVSTTSKAAEDGAGEFRRMLEVQRGMSGEKERKYAEFEDEEYYDYDRPANPTPPLYSSDIEDDDAIYDPAYEHAYEPEIDPIRPLTFSDWTFDALADLLPRPFPLRDTFHDTRKSSNPFSPTAIYEEEEEEMVQAPNRHSIALVTPTIPRLAATLNASRRMSYPLTPNSPTLTCFSQGGNEKENWSHFKDTMYGSYYGHDLPEHRINEELEGDPESDIISGAGRVAVNLRRMTAKTRRRLSHSVTIQVPKLGDEVVEKENLGGVDPPKFFSTLIKGYPSIPAKPLLILGLLICLVSGTMTPVFSFLLSSLLYQVSIGGKDTTMLNLYGGIVLGVAALDGLLLGLKYFVMEQVGMMWATKLRNLAFEKVIGQDKSWFDLAGSSSIPSSSSSSSLLPSSSSSPTEGSNDIPHLIQKMVTDGDEARNLISVIVAQTIVVSTMLSVGIIWALIRGWELTLMGLAILPVFATAMAVQTRLISKCERRNKTAREEISKAWYEVLKNVKGIRYMGIEKVFKEKFHRAVAVAEERGMKGAWVEGASYGVASSLIYVAEAALFYVGAVLIANGRYTYLKMVQVLNLVVFTVTIGSQLMAFTQKIAKSTQASHDLMLLTHLSTSNTSESKGILKPSQSVLSSGPVSFRNISFAYPSNPNTLTLKSFNLTIQPGECVAVVGASGSGKSTVAALLQRMYEPLEGRIRFGDFDVCDVDAGVLRSGMGVVEQSVKVFEDKSVEENILYGQVDMDEAGKAQVVRRAAELANIDWISPDEGDGFKAILGEVSGGQAQRIGVARALARSNDIDDDGLHLLILDECTSALDVENQKQVMEAITNIRSARRHENLKMVVVTHKVEVMRMCDRLVVIKDGQVVENGEYEELMEKKGGVFRELARGGVWET